MTEQVVHSETAGGVCTVTLDDPERKNALSAQLTGELMDALDAAEADDDVRVIVLTNTGTTFCAGADLSERSGRRADRSRRPVDPADMFARFGRSPKPYVGRINGHCVAGGMGLAAAMDYSVVLETAKMGFTEVRIGVADPSAIDVDRIAAQVPYGTVTVTPEVGGLDVAAESGDDVLIMANAAILVGFPSSHRATD